MSLSCLTIWLLIIQLNFVTVVLGEECPVCTNKYDHKSCTQTQSCDADMNYCELIVKPDDFYSLEYVCKQALECVDQETVVCDPSANETCIYCCDGPTICQLQREELYNSEFPSSGLLDPSTTQATECPVCSYAYDQATCLGIQKCPFYTDGICQLVINTTGLLRLDYQCGHFETCAAREADGCHPEVNNTCTYCCSDPITCQLQREDLFTYEFYDLGLLELSTTPDGPVGTTLANPPATSSTDRPVGTTLANPTTRSTGVVTTNTSPALVTSTTSITTPPSTDSDEVTSNTSPALVTSTRYQPSSSTLVTSTTSTTTTPSPADSAAIECPVCSNDYDHTTCLRVQKCPGADAVCQLVIHTGGQLRLEYQCEQFEVCTGREAYGCHPEVNNTCTYCCSDPIICQLQRDDLFTYELPSLGLPTNILATTTATAAPATSAPTTSASTATPTTRTASVATETPVTTISQTTSTVTPATATETTATSIATQTTSTTAASIETQATATTTSSPPTETAAASTETETTATTTTQQTTMSSTTPATIRCVQCGEFSGHTSCKPDDHVLNQPEACPNHLPYCFSRFAKNSTDISIYKGCATADFCTLEYELTSTKRECDDPVLNTASHVSCGYCCSSNDCNAPLKPTDSLLSFP